MTKELPAGESKVGLVPAAIFGIIGVVVGGLISGGVQWLGRWIDRRDRRRVALRPLFRELRSNRAALYNAQMRGAWWAENALRTSTVARYGAELASVLSPDEWDAVLTAEAGVAGLLRPTRLADRPGSQALGQIAAVVSAIDRTLRALGQEREMMMSEVTDLAALQGANRDGVDLVRAPAAWGRGRGGRLRG